MTDFKNAGIEKQIFGSKGQFHRTLQRPWTVRLTHEPRIGLYVGIARKFSVVEEITLGGVSRARIVDDKNGQIFDIEIFPDKIKVFPTSNEHQISSEQLLKIFEMHGGVLEQS
jgi:hypothetical protein